MIKTSSKADTQWLLALMAGVASTFAVGLGTATPAAAQSTPNVIVDLSVLNGPGGYAPYPPPAYGAPQPYGQAAQPYAAPPTYGQPVPQYGVPQPYGQPVQPYGGQQPYGAPQPYGQSAQPYGGQQANIQPVPAYGGYLIMPNAGYGPPQATMLAPPPAYGRAPAPPPAYVQAPAPQPVTAQRTARNAPIKITADPPARPKVKTSEIAAGGGPAAKPVKVASPAATAVPAPAIAPKVATAPTGNAAANAAIVRSEPKPAPVSVRIATAKPPKTAPAAVPTPAAPAAPAAVPPTATAAPTVNAPTVAPAPPAAVIVSPATPPAEKVQVAARTPSAASGGGQGLAIPFDTDSAELEDST